MKRRPLLVGLTAIACLAVTCAPLGGALAADQDMPAPTRSIHSEGNPIIGDGSLYTADAATLVEDDRLYVYAGRDQASPTYGGFNMTDYVVMATDDVESGTWDVYEKNLVPVSVFDWATGNNAYAGEVAKGADGRFYWYVPVEWKNTTPANRMAIGVAVSDTPVGPWKDAIGEPLMTWTDVFGSSSTGQEVIDPTVMIDDDGKVYLYWGSWYVARVQELESDMITKKGAITQMTGLSYFFEAPWVMKEGNTYYLLYDWKNGGSECTPSNYQACIAYATASSPKGPWTYQGLVVSGTSATTVHPALIEFNDKWYMTYQTKDAEGGGHFRRSVAIDQVQWDGKKILPVKTTRGDDPAWRLTLNVAPEATPSASYTEQPPMRLAALNDGRAPAAILPPDQWGNYRSTTSTVASDWIMYQWDEPVLIDSMGMMFHRDSNWIRPPASWSLEYLGSDGDWHPLSTKTTPTATGTWNTAQFSQSVVATALRMTLTGQQSGSYYNSVSVSEWEVYAAEGSVTVPEVTTQIGQAPVLPAALRLTAQNSSVWAPVTWQTTPASDYAETGHFTVKGRVLGYASEYVELPVTVTEDGSVTPSDDDEAPTVTIGLIGTAGKEGWYSSAVTAQIRAEDNVDFTMQISAKIDGGDWAVQNNARLIEVTTSSDGEHTAYGKAKDQAGNESEAVSRSFKIDRTAPVAKVSVTDRQATVTASDALSGVDSFQYRFDDSEWVVGELGVAIPPPDGLPHKFSYRVTDLAGNQATGSADIPRDENTKLTGNLAPYATPTASYTASWNAVSGLNDGTLEPLSTAGNKGVEWATWPKVGELWTQLTWDFPVTVDTVGIWWFADSADSANAGVIPPREWKLQYLDGSTWKDVVTEDEYGRARDVFNSVVFEPVTTTAVRAVMQAWGSAEGGGSPGIWEMHVLAADAVDPVDPEPEPDPTLDVAIKDSSSCKLGKAFPTVTVTNNEEVTVSAKLTFASATETLTIPAGKSSTYRFTGPASVEAGSIAVEAAAEIDGKTITTELLSEYPALSCK